MLFSTVFQVAILQKINHGCTTIKCNFMRKNRCKNNQGKLEPVLAMKAYWRVGVTCHSILNPGTTQGELLVTNKNMQTLHFSNSCSKYGINHLIFFIS